MLRRVVKAILLLPVLLGFGFCAFVNLVNAPHKGETDAANRALAQAMVAALMAHSRATGGYPSDLEALVPDYLDQLPPKQRLDWPFHYQLEQGGRDFALSYPEAPYGALPSDAYFRYRSNTGRWEHGFH